jgi:4-amino-4-deoxy-L-arabinose transferase-like glycosyltransferase/multidrug transporter EmrE-like cation transporter
MGWITRAALVLLAAATLALSAANLFRPLANPDEGRYSEIAREMAVSGDWITPRLNDLKYFEKPPLQYWATALAFKAFGVHEWSARLYVTLSAYAILAMVAFTAARLGAREDALASTLALLASPYFMGLSGAVTLDMGLTLWLTAALCAWLLAEHEGTPPPRRRRWMLAMWAAMALAVLSKGLVGVVIPGATLALLCLVRRDFSPLARLEWLRGLALFLAITVPWFVAVSLRNPEFAQFFFIHEHFQRYLTTSHRRVEPWWYFVPIVLLGFLPLAATLPGALARAWRAGGPWLGLALWSAFVVLFFSASGSKLPAYVLPAFPALALLLGPHLARLPERRLALWVAPTLVVALGAAVVASRSAERAREDWTRLLYVAAEPWLVGAALVLAAGIALAAFLLWHRLRWAGLAASALAVVAALGCGLEGFERFSPRQSGKIPAERMRAAAAGLELRPGGAVLPRPAGAAGEVPRRVRPRPRRRAAQGPRHLRRFRARMAAARTCSGYNAARPLPRVPPAGIADATRARRSPPHRRPQAVNPLTFSLVMAGVLLNAAAQLLLKAGTTRVGEFAFTLDNVCPVGWRLATNPYIAGGLACYVVSVVVWILALSRVPVSIAYPMLSVGYIVNALAAWYLFGESLTAQKLLGIGFIMIGVYLVARS